MVKVKIIIGSTRPKRFGPQVGNWLMELTKEHPEATFELIDLQAVNLPLLDEPEVPSSGNYTKEHTKRWSAMIAEADGFIWVHPEYNHGISAALKNAIDFLWKEWNHKPVALVGYGAEAGGARAAEQLRLVAAGCMMFDLRTQLTIPNYYTQFDDAGNFQPNERQIKQAHSVLKEIAFWSSQMLRARQELESLAK